MEKPKMVVFVVKRYAVREAKKWQYAVRKAKIERYVKGVSPSLIVGQFKLPVI